jgi:transcription initiation factor TFIIH subunit 2
VDHIRVLDDYMDQSLLTGELSLQNSLELSRSILKQSPEQGSREILLLMASMTSRDPDDIQSTVQRLLADRIRCSIVSLSAEVNVCKQICRQTGGEYRVAMNEAHYRDLLWSLLPPPPILVAQSAKSAARMILMGFPDRSLDSTQKMSLCSWYVK